MEIAANLILLVSALAGFLSFAWSVVGQFDDSGKINRLGYNLLRLGSVLTWLLALYAIITLQQPNWLAWSIGLALNLAALLLFWWTSRTSGKRNLRLVFSEVPPHQLFTGGPYNLVRHPFYSAYLLAYLSVALATLDLPVLLCSLMMAVIYHKAAQKEEGFFLAGPLAAEYRAYQATTGRFLPRLWSAGPAVIDPPESSKKP